MVVLVDLDDPDDAQAHLVHRFPPTPATSTKDDDSRPNPNINGFSAALSCYPIVSQLARQLDLNTLHSLSRTCRQFRANLLEYRDQLIRHTLHCVYEDDGPGPRLGSRLLEARANFYTSRQLTSGRVGKCARDMVAECQRCSTVVCRNCTVKPPPTPTLRARHRRLCRTCTKAPLSLLTTTKRPRSSSGTPSPPGTPDFRASLFDDDDAPRAFTSPAFERTPCICDDTVWLCQPCGQHLKNADTMYVRAWTWRTRYSHYLGGVGTGAGEGNEGVECGRGPSCLAARAVEHEVDYNADIAEAYGSLESNSSHSPERWTGTSYHTQEIEGIGGVVKMKLKKQVYVGECVKIYEDERDKSIRWLEREVSGKLRSWCSWCERVVPGEKDKAEAQGVRPPSSGSSSPASSR
ncbi:uncharacterized protein N0V89_008037 [Didymosphaeria variabile]|uniref:F-box domain-containing protein n=1 Tax=Didymosphaeria variabile TaxID=1932322 RepID=A0A9W8XG07_9PLEO|nr:uncharacterized protein N0V89_008037 [Didymosphaeria variabile]KAJ4349422.1 hypothetical protein N0V89_008037 [Didymosphaeria variabile]